MFWDGLSQGSEFYDLSDASPGETLIFAQQVNDAVADTGRYRWTMTITFDNYPTPITASVDSEKFVVVEDDSPWGAGWTFAATDRLYHIPLDNTGPNNVLPEGFLRTYGTDGDGFYETALTGTMREIVIWFRECVNQSLFHK